MPRITILTGLIVVATLTAVACGGSDDGGEQAAPEAASQAATVAQADSGASADTAVAEPQEPATATAAAADEDEAESAAERAAEPQAEAEPGAERAPEADAVAQPDAEEEPDAPAVEEEDAPPTVTVPRPYIYEAGIGVGFDLPFIERLDFEIVPAEARGPVPGTGNPGFIRIGLVEGVAGSAPIVFSPLAPQIHIYPVEDYAALFDAVGPEVDRLRAVLASVAGGADPSGAGVMPFLPPIAGEQVFQAQVEVLAFLGGSGIRYLTQYSDGPHSITNQSAFYTFQGLTDDGAFYVAAFFPIRTSALLDRPAPDIPFGQVIGDDFPAYVENIAHQLDGLSAADFEVGLGFLDTMIEEMEVTPDLAQLRAARPAAGEEPSGFTVLVFVAKAGAEFPWDVAPVALVSPTSAVAQFAVDALIAGSTPDQPRFGSAWDREMFSADSDCGEQDYRLQIEDGTATIQFCRTVPLSGVVRDAQMDAQLTATLLQFATVNRVVILNRGGHCMFDLSGFDLCLEDSAE